MTETLTERPREEYKKRLLDIVELVFRAGEAAGLNRIYMQQARQFQGCSFLVLGNGVLFGDIHIYLYFGLPGKLLKSIGIQVGVWADNRDALPYLYDSREIERREFPLDKISDEWLVNAIKTGIAELQSMCTAANFKRLKKEFNQRNGIE